MSIERIRLTQEGQGSVHNRVIAVDPLEDILQIHMCPAVTRSPARWPCTYERQRPAFEHDAIPRFWQISRVAPSIMDPMVVTR